MIKNPRVSTTAAARIVAGTPFNKKSFVFKYRSPIVSSWFIAAMFGNPLTGNPIPAEQIRAVAIIKSLP